MKRQLVTLEIEYEEVTDYGAPGDVSAERWTRALHIGGELVRNDRVVSVTSEPSRDVDLGRAGFRPIGSKGGWPAGSKGTR